MVEKQIVFRNPKGRTIATRRATALAPAEIESLRQTLAEQNAMPPEDLKISLEWDPGTANEDGMWLLRLMDEVRKLLAREYEDTSEKSLRDALKDLTKVPVAYTETEDGKHFIQIYADLIDMRLISQVDGDTVETWTHGDVGMMIQDLKFFDFDTAVADAEAAWRTKNGEVTD